jgi:hypothetical protein
MRPTLSELSRCRRLCNGDSRYAIVFEWNGLAVKVYQYGGGGFTNPAVTVEKSIQGLRRLEAANVPAMPILDHWTDGKDAFIIQLIGTPVEYDQETFAEAKQIALSAYEAGVADVVPQDIMLHHGRLVIVDFEEVFDEDEWWYGQNLAEVWGEF